LIRMKRLPVYALLLLLASVVAAAAQTSTAPSAQKPAGSTATGAPSAQKPAGSAGAGAPSAQKPAAPAAVGQAKVAVVLFQAAVTQTNEFQRDFADLQKKFDPKRAQLKKLSDDIDTLTKQLQTQGPQLTESERVSRSRAIEEKKRLLERETQDAQADFESQSQQLLNTLAGKVGGVMTELATKLGFTLILDSGNQQNPTVLYAIPQIDITRAVIDAYNTKSGIPAPLQPKEGQPGMDAPQPVPAPAH
jgi:outer membrane protein